MSKTPHLSSAEAAAVLGVSSSTVNRMVAAGRIKPLLKLSGKTGPYLFTATEVQRVAKALANSKHAA